MVTYDDTGQQPLLVHDVMDRVCDCKGKLVLDGRNELDVSQVTAGAFSYHHGTPRDYRLHIS